MSGLLPLVRSNSACVLYPVTRTVEFSTAIKAALNATEQRARRRPPLTRLSLAYSLINGTERDSIVSFLESQKGPFDSTWGAVVGKVAPGCTIASGTFTNPAGTFASSDVGADVVNSTAAYVGKITAVASSTSASVSNVVGSSASGLIRWGYYVPNLTLDDTQFQGTEPALNPLSYGFTIKARQTKNPGCTSGASGGAFPTLASGATSQLPYSLVRRYQVLVSDNGIAGMRFAWAWLGAGLSGFPTGSLHGWQLSFPVITDAELRTLEAHIRAQWGAYAAFPFTDPETGTTYANCRYADDAFEVLHRDFNQNSVTVKIQEFNA